MIVSYLLYIYILQTMQVELFERKPLRNLNQRDMVKRELQVTSYELQITSYELKV